MVDQVGFCVLCCCVFTVIVTDNMHLHSRELARTLSFFYCFVCYDLSHTHSRNTAECDRPVQ